MSEYISEALRAHLKDLWRPFVEPKHVNWTWRVLEALYTEPHRVYHTLRHLHACMELWKQSPGEHPVVQLALFWHDAVYVPGDKRNEELSANLLRSLQPIPWAVHTGHWDRACNAILATRNHETVVNDEVAQLVIDIDLAVLGEPPYHYARYVDAIRSEYAVVSDEAWNVGRSGFLATMIARERIYQTDWARARYEKQARENMQQELLRLETKSP